MSDSATPNPSRSLIKAKEIIYSIEKSCFQIKKTTPTMNWETIVMCEKEILLICRSLNIKQLIL